MFWNSSREIFALQVALLTECPPLQWQFLKMALTHLSEFRQPQVGLQPRFGRATAEIAVLSIPGEVSAARAV